MDDLSIRLAVPEDRHDVGRFMGELYPANALQNDPERWDWMYGGGGHAKIILAHVAGSVAGHLAVMPAPLAVNGDERRLTWVCNLVVSREHRRKGIMTQMLEWAAAEFAPLAVAGANEYSRPLFRKMGWRHVGAPRRYTRVVAPLSWLVGKARRMVRSQGGSDTRAVRLPPVSGDCFTYESDIDVRPVERFDQDADHLRQAVARQTAIVGRTSERLNWRFVDRPRSTYQTLGAYRGDRLCGWSVIGARTETQGIKGYIVDMLWRPADEAAGRALVSVSTKLLRRAGASTIHCTASWSGLVALLQAGGFREREEDYHVLVPPALSELSLESWHLTRGDANMDGYLFGGFTMVSPSRAGDGARG